MHANHFSSAWGTSNFQYHCRAPYKLLKDLASSIKEVKEECEDQQWWWGRGQQVNSKRLYCSFSDIAVIESYIIPLSVLLSSIVFLQFNNQDAWSFTTLYSPKLVCTQYFKNASHESSLKRRIEELNNFEASKRLGEVVVLVV